MLPVIKKTSKKTRPHKYRPGHKCLRCIRVLNKLVLEVYPVGSRIRFRSEWGYAVTGEVVEAKKGEIVVLSPAPARTDKEFEALGVTREWYVANWLAARQRISVPPDRVTAILG